MVVLLAGCGGGGGQREAARDVGGTGKVTVPPTATYDPVILAETLVRDYPEEGTIRVGGCKISGGTFQCVGEGNKTFAINGQIRTDRSYIATISVNGSAIAGVYPADTGGRGLDMGALKEAVVQRAQESGVAKVVPAEAKCGIDVDADRTYTCALGGDLYVHVTVAADLTYKAQDRDPVSVSFSGSLRSR